MFIKDKQVNKSNIFYHNCQALPLKISATQLYIQEKKICRMGLRGFLAQDEFKKNFLALFDVKVKNLYHGSNI